MECHPIYIVGKLLCCDFMMNNVPGRELPTIYYRRKSQMLNMMRNVLLRPDSPFSLKLYTIMTVIWEAVSTRQPELPIHMQAMDSLVESYGGTSVFMNFERSGPTMRPESFVGMFIIIEYHIPQRIILDIILDRFMNCLKRINYWTKATQMSSLQRTVPDLLISSHQIHRAKSLGSLKKFLTDAMMNRAFFAPTTGRETGPGTCASSSTCIRTDRNTATVPFFLSASPFFYTFNICMTYIENNYTPIQALDFLEQVQQNLHIVNHDCAMGGVALANLFADSRVQMSSTPWRRDDRGVGVEEVKICQASIDALKVYALMSAETRSELTWLLYDMAMVVVTSWSPNEKDEVEEAEEEVSGEMQLNMWRTEVSKA